MNTDVNLEVLKEAELLASEHWNATHDAGDLWHNQHTGVREEHMRLFRGSALRRVIAATEKQVNELCEIERIHCTPGLSAIVNERIRQIYAEGFSAKHDAEHGAAELAMAACCYAYPPEESYPGRAEWWPFEPYLFKEGPTRKRELEKAGALIAAAIDVIVAQEMKAAKEAGEDETNT